MSEITKAIALAAVAILLFTLWANYLRSPTIDVILPIGYIGEVFITFGDKSQPYLSNKCQYHVGKNGLLISEYNVPRGRILGSSFCFKFAYTEDCLPVVYGNRAKLLKKESNAGIVVMAPNFTDYRSFRLSNDSIVDFPNGYISAVVDSLNSKQEYDRDIKDLFELLTRIKD